MTTTPADPAAIDLEELQARRKPFDGQLSVADTDRLIAAVEALRARIKIIKGNLESEAFFWKEQAEAAEARVAELEVFTGHLRASRDHAVQANEAAEARVAELAGALEPLIDDDECRLDHSGFCQTHTNELDDGRCAMAVANTVLAATPAEALERARAKDAVITEYRKYVDGGYYGSAALDAALMALDALGKEESRNG